MATNSHSFQLGSLYEDRKQRYEVVAIDPTSGTIDVRGTDGVVQRAQDAAIKWRIWQNIERERAAIRSFDDEAVAFAPQLGCAVALPPPQKTYSPEYLRRIEATLRSFLRNGDDVVAVGFFIRPGGLCQLCSHEPIKWHYVIANLRGDRVLTIGSECVTNYTMILRRWGYRPDHIAFPNFLRFVTKWIQCEGGVLYDDALVMRFQGDVMASIPTVADDYRVMSHGPQGPFGVDKARRRYFMSSPDTLAW